LTFGSNQLKKNGYTQAVWTLLAICEERFFKNIVLQPLENEIIHVFVDTTLNALTYPLRVCFKEANKKEIKLDRILIDEHYKDAMKWLDDAIDYGYFCTIFPFWHKNKIDIEVSGNELIPTDWTELALEYEAYNRLYRDPINSNIKPKIDTDIIDPILRNSRITKVEYQINFNPKFVEKLVNNFSESLETSYYLPENWRFTYFSIGEFKRFFKTVQSMMYAWFLARAYLFSEFKDMGYASSVWVVPKNEFLNRLIRYTKLKEGTVKSILKYLEFGSSDIREPDIALQPLVDLMNGHYALSPFLWLNSNPERNLCVLLNQIPHEKIIYSGLVNEKEKIMIDGIKDDISNLKLDIKIGKIKDTNIDCALIDHNERTCLILELKWFIEPAEIREVIERSEEIVKGIVQLKKIVELFNFKDEQLVKGVLGIEYDYTFFCAVATQNWIGEFDVQDSDIPVIKIKQLLMKIKEYNSLTKTINWLRNRSYLPKEDRDFCVVPIDISFGKWKSRWYGIKPS